MKIINYKQDSKAINFKIISNTQIKNKNMI